VIGSRDEPVAREASVLICDDERMIRRLLAEIVEMANGVRVAGEAADGSEAVREAERLRPEIILLDLAMPVRTGLEVLPELRELVPATQIIAFSGFSRAVLGEQALEAGADVYVEKGAPVAEVLSALEQAASRTRSPTPPA